MRKLIMMSEMKKRHETMKVNNILNQKTTEGLIL